MCNIPDSITLGVICVSQKSISLYSKYLRSIMYQSECIKYLQKDFEKVIFVNYGNLWSNDFDIGNVG